ncbi:Cell surface glycoprotein CD200 receptor 1 [Galemys pyrenaicus]|uniref:Cell surface glycoprotein CD200 receptor 1 n=1 Tax=Galemys pyrenaicus TaxID=202257 RepID=A0A8J5ZTH8_GALPY|nr:Cell surface glycoprotein CD200 receptor 1 [Galemys pyrenaicus]
MLVTWTILLRDERPCTRVYSTDKNMVEGNCTDPRITWPFIPDQNSALQIDPVSITHDGNYICDVATQAGNFLHRYDLQVQVPPAVTLFLTENRTAVCKAAAGKPAAQISWTPGGDCVTEEETLGNGTVTVQSTCHWAERNVSAVSCSVFHLTGNKILSLELSRANRSLSVPVDTKVMLSCPFVQSVLTLVTWIILLRDECSCTKVYRKDKNMVEGNCTDPRITWPFRPDQNPALQIDPVSITHDGNYICDVATQAGNFLHRYDLQVQVPPAVTLFLTENRTAVCKAAAGKPAAQISWTPGGDCVTEEETLGNGTVTVQSTCHWAERNVSAVSCSVFHLTGNKILSLELSGECPNPLTDSPSTDFKIIQGAKNIGLYTMEKQGQGAQPGEAVGPLDDVTDLRRVVAQC